MAVDTLQQLDLLVKPETLSDVHILTDGATPTVLSTEVAAHFQKKHQHVLRDIDRLCSILPKSFCASNFGRTCIDVKQPNGGERKQRAYRLTRDAFSLLVMGFTGPAAIRWKLKYIEAFNALERAVMERQTDLAREAGYLEGRQETLCLPVMEAERKAGYLEGLKEGKRLAKKRDSFALLEKIAGYREKGLTYKEIAKLLDMKTRAVTWLVQKSRALAPARKPMLTHGAL